MPEHGVDYLSAASGRGVDATFVVLRGRESFTPSHTVRNYYRDIRRALPTFKDTKMWVVDMKRSLGGGHINMRKYCSYARNMTSMIHATLTHTSRNRQSQI
jgi:hypothetical protein